MRLHPSGPVVALSFVLIVLDVSAAPRTGLRIKRQLPPLEQGNQVIDNIFQIPIGTLNAVGSLIKSARPLVRRTRERIQQYYSGGQQPQSSAVSQQQYYSSGSRPSSVQALMSPFVNRPYYTSYYNNNGNGNGNRRKQQRGEDLPPQGRHRHHGDRDDDY